MTVATQRSGRRRRLRRALRRRGSSGLADVIELILDKGLVIDVFVRVSLVGIELLTIDARIVVASVDTYLRFAEATNRLDLYGKGKGGAGLPDLVQGMTESGAKGKTTASSKGPSRRWAMRSPVGVRTARRLRAGVPASAPGSRRRSEPDVRVRRGFRRHRLPEGLRGLGPSGRCRSSLTARSPRLSVMSRWTGHWAPAMTS